MIQIVKCPSCGAPLEFTGATVEKCKFCGSRISFLSDESLSESASYLEDKQKLDNILQIARSGNKIQAIKVFRETFGAGLKEAKDAVESLERGENIDLQIYKSRKGIKTVDTTGCLVILTIGTSLFIVVMISITFYITTNL